MPVYHFELTLEIEGPVLTKSTSPTSHGLDAPFARNWENRLVIPGTLLKGRMRQAVRELSAYGTIADRVEWFGPDSDNSDNKGHGNRGYREGSFERFNTRLFISDAVCEKKGASAHRTRIRQDEQLGAASDQMLQVLESPLKAGEKARFTSRITFYARSGETVEDIRGVIIKSLKWAVSLGANTTVGFGRIKDIKCVPQLQETTTAPVPAGDDLFLSLTTIDPICVTERGGVTNVFETQSVIPGAVLKGAVAAYWSRLLGKQSAVVEPDLADGERRALATHFDKIRFSHARPSDADLDPQAVPLSLGYLTGVKQFRDFSAHENPPGDLGKEVVAFGPDWKDGVWTKARKSFGWPELKTELRVRTAIEFGVDKAKDNYLFAYETIQPRKEMRWNCTVSFDGIENRDARKAARDELWSLLRGGIRGVGKTKAYLQVQCRTEPIQGVFPSQLARDADEHVMVLQTPALLVDPTSLIGSRSSTDLKTAYASTFTSLSGGKLKLKHFFALHDLRGGVYLYERFQKGRRTEKYEPYLLTRPGSVFVFEGTGPEVLTLLGEWLRRGIPTPQWSVDRFGREGRRGDHWRDNPYIRENGYGEVAVYAREAKEKELWQV